MRYYIFAIIIIFMNIVIITTFFSCDNLLLDKRLSSISSNNNDSGGGLADIFAEKKKNDKHLTSPNIRVSQGGYGNKIVVAWNAVANAHYYQVLRSKKQNDALSFPFTVVAQVVQTTFYEDTFDIHAMPLDDLYASYQYKVASITYNGSKNMSLQSQDAYLLLPPRTLTGTKSLPSITITWETIRGAERYRIYRSDSSNSLGTLLPFVSGKMVRSFTDTTPDLEFAKPYYYYVVSVNYAGERSTVDVQNHPYALGIRIKSNAPKPPKVSASKATSLSEIVVSWDTVLPSNPSNRIVYNLFKNSSISSRIIDIAANIESTQYIDDTSIQKNVEYHYFVQAIEISSDDVKLVGGYSADIDVSLKEDNPQTGYVLSSPNAKDIDIRYVDRNIEITWVKIKKATGYKIYSAPAINGTYTELTTLGDVNTYTHEGVVADTASSVFYKILSIREDINIPLVTLLSKTQAIEPRPSIPENVQASRNTYESDYSELSIEEIYPIKITWNPANGAHRYTVWRSHSKDGIYDIILTDIEITKAYDKSNDMEIGKYYYYKISAQNRSGISSDVSKASDGGYGALTNLALMNQVLRTIGSSHQKLKRMHNSGSSALGSETKNGDISGEVAYNGKLVGVVKASVTNRYTNYADQDNPFVIIDGTNITDVSVWNQNGSQRLNYTITGMYPATITGRLTITSSVASGGGFDVKQDSGVPHGKVQNSEVIQP